MLDNLKVPGPWCLVLPLYEAERIGAIIIPDGYENPISQQGRIIVAGQTSIFRADDHVLLQPYQGTTFMYGEREYFRYLDTHIVARVVDRRIVPKPLDVLVRPNFRTNIEKNRLVYKVQDLNWTNPQASGTIVTVGRECCEVAEGDTVLLPPFSGYEVGFIDTVYYLIPEADLLCKLPSEKSE